MKYHGTVWGKLPDEYPQALAERTYRDLLDLTEDLTRWKKLMGQGFKGTAYRWCGAKENHEKYHAFIQEHGPAPITDASRNQEVVLFGFFSSGLSVIECFSFSLYALGAYLNEKSFPLDDSSLRKVKPELVNSLYEVNYSNLSITATISTLISDEMYKRWKRIRNVLTHRAVPPRHHIIRVGAEPTSIWAVEDSGVKDADQDFIDLTVEWWEWLTKETNSLWQALADSMNHFENVQA